MKYFPRLYNRKGDFVQSFEFDKTPDEMADWLLAAYDEGYSAHVEHPHRWSTNLPDSEQSFMTYLRPANVTRDGKDVHRAKLVTALSRVKG